MNNFVTKVVNPARRASLYCVWIRPRETEGAPLIQVWIDPSMSAFESQAVRNQPAPAATPSDSAAEVADEVEEKR